MARVTAGPSSRPSRFTDAAGVLQRDGQRSGKETQIGIEQDDMDGNTTWEKLPAIEGKHGGCLKCGPRPSYFPADGIIAVGFGYAALHRDGEPVYTEPTEAENNDAYMTGAQAGAMAAADPEHDWRIVMDGPLSGRTYQRHGPGHWALVEQNMGFA